MKLESAGKSVLVESMGHNTSGATPDIAALADGRILLVWTEDLTQPTDTSDDTDGAIFARILNGDGTPDGEIFQVNDARTFAQDRPHVVVFPGGGFAIGWTSNAKYGDGPGETDTFLKVFSDFGGQLTSGPAFDIVPDNPAGTIKPNKTSDQSLREMVALDSDRVALVLENGATYIYSTGARSVDKLASNDITDIAMLENGNIVNAGPSGNGKEVKLVLTDGNFSVPDGFSGIYNPLTFFLKGSTDKAHKIGKVELAALKGGGFAVAYAEKSGDLTSVIRLNIISDEAVKEFTGQNLGRQFEFDSPVAKFDMISLSNGGFALALVIKDTDGTGIEIRLYDANGKLSTKLPVTDTDIGDQADPSLTQLPDGTVVLSYTDTSDPATAGETNGMRLAFFDLDGASGKFVGTGGDDFLGGVGGNDRIFGLGGDDEIKGRDGDDRLHGGDGNDTLEGGDGQDALRGGAGDDTLKGGNDNDGIGGGSGVDNLSGGQGGDVLGGGTGNDVLRGGAGRDVLKGGADDDRLFGDGGNDILKGQSGDDILTGGGGADTFVFARGHVGDDTVKDFDEAQDIIAIHLRGLNEASVQVAINGTDTEITFATNTITLEGVALDKADITFDFF